MLKPILIGISPNAQFTDVLLALKLLLQPWLWQTGQFTGRLTAKIKTYFNFPHVYLTNSARTALYLGLKSLNLSSAEVLYPSFTCQVVPQAIIKAGLKPIGYELGQIKAKITSQTKVLIIQHLFGIPDDMAFIASLCKKHQLILIEDLAHSLGATFKGKKVGSFGEITVLSFGRDKIISSIFGGALLTRESVQLNMPLPGYFWIFKQLLHPLIFSLAVPAYYYFGKYLIHLCRKLNLIALPLNQLVPEQLPNALAGLALHQWQRLDSFNRHRRQIARLYCQAFNQPFHPEATYLRFPLIVKDPIQLIKLAKLEHLWLGNWYENKIINLPTHPRMNLSDVQRVVDFIKSHA
ncbi:MAG: DegT/DnrJ/EryC1/StrS family aminotransferase [Patescibacteria group bacterium]